MAWCAGFGGGVMVEAGRCHPQARLEKTLMEKVPGITAVRDATDHETGTTPYIARDHAA